MSINSTYDLIVIGGGPGGYVAAIRASQLGLKVLCIEKRKTLGGTCLNVGCIPSKNLLHSSFLYQQSRTSLEDYGILINGNISLDLDKMMFNKENSISKLTNGVSALLKKNKVEYKNGSAKIITAGQVEVDEEIVGAKKILISTGSEVAKVSNVNIDEKNIVSSTGALEFNEVPKKLAVIGGGYIGLELGSVWNRLGSDVTVIEFSSSIVPMMDKDTADIYYKTLVKQGVNFLLGTKVESADKQKQGVKLRCLSLKDNKNIENIYDKVLVAVGRKPFTGGLGIESLGIVTNKQGAIVVDENFQTNITGIYAIGDVIEGPMLAHKASAEGHVFAEKIVGNKPELNYGTIPAVIYTEPEVSWVGPTEKELKEKNIPYKKGIFPFSANPRSKTIGDTTGNVKVISHKKTDRVLAVHIIGAHAGELISQAVTAMEAGLSAEDIALTCHAHPTLSESMKEAASLASIGKTLHF